MPLDIRRCPGCGARVVAMADGTCPACKRHSLSQKTEDSGVIDGEQHSLSQQDQDSRVSDAERKVFTGKRIAAVGLAVAAVAALLFGGYLVDDGLLGGFWADKKEIGIGLVFLAAGFLLLCHRIAALHLSAERTTTRKMKRLAVLLLLGIVVIFGIVEAGRKHARRDCWVQVPFALFVKIGDDYDLPPWWAVRPARWYESGIKVVEPSSGSEIKMPKKYISKGFWK